MSIEKRPERASIRVSGPEAAKLLNNVLTGEFRAGSDDAHWWALLSPQGKIQAEGLAGFADNAFWLDLDASIADDFLKRMRLYKLRADVTLEDLRETHAVGWSPEPVTDGVAHGDPRAADLGWRIIDTKEAAAGWNGAPGGWAKQRIAAGVAELGPDFAADSQFPHDVGMDLLGGIDFEKGCYVGQEVVSRMKHRGTARRRPVLVKGDGLEAGAAIVCNGREAGSVGNVADGRAIGILRLDRLGADGSAEADGRPVALALPFWASYRFGDSGAA